LVHGFSPRGAALGFFPHPVKQDLQGFTEVFHNLNLACAPEHGENKPVRNREIPHEH
jgi:hypothetical protein